MNNFQILSCLPRAIAIVSLALASGCASRQPTIEVRSRSYRPRLEVSISPVKEKSGWYEFSAVIDRHKALWTDAGQKIGEGHDHYVLPTLQVPMGGEASHHMSGKEGADTGIRGKFRVFQEGDQIIAEYELGYDSDEDYAYTKARVALSEK